MTTIILFLLIIGILFITLGVSRKKDSIVVFEDNLVIGIVLIIIALVLIFSN